MNRKWYKPTMIGISVILLAAIVYVYFGGEEAPSFPDQGPAAPFKLTDTEGNAVSMENTLGQVKLLYFFFANCPDVCPPTSHMLSRVQDRLKEAGVFGTDVQILQVTIDPERDTAENLAKYAANMNADPSGWHFLRGSVEDTKTIADSYGIMYQQDEKTGFYIHANTVMMIDQDNTIRMRYSADDLDDEIISEDVLQLVKS